CLASVPAAEAGLGPRRGIGTRAGPWSGAAVVVGARPGAARADARLSGAAGNASKRAGGRRRRRRLAGVGGAGGPGTRARAGGTAAGGALVAAAGGHVTVRIASLAVGVAAAWGG